MGARPRRALRPRDVGYGSDPAVYTSEIPAVADDDHIALGITTMNWPLFPRAAK